ncbi:MAG: TonB family protein [Bacteroidota bacterium]
MKPFLVLVFSMIILLSFGQDTLYLNKQLKPSARYEAEYFEIKKIQELNLTVTKYKISGDLVSMVEYLLKEPEIKHGRFLSYYPDNVIKTEGYYTNGKKDSIWTDYDLHGNIDSQYLFKIDTVITLLGTPYEEKVKTLVEKMPVFPGGDIALQKYIRDNVKYPKKARRKGIEGKVVVTFIISKTGYLKNAHIAKGIGYGCDEVVLEMMNNMPQWTPGMQDGKTVNVSFALPVIFKLVNN